MYIAQITSKELDHTAKLKNLYSDESLDSMCAAGVIEADVLYESDGLPVDVVRYLSRDIPEVPVVEDGDYDEDAEAYEQLLADFDDSNLISHHA